MGRKANKNKKQYLQNELPGGKYSLEFDDLRVTPGLISYCFYEV